MAIHIVASTEAEGADLRNALMPTMRPNTSELGSMLPQLGPGDCLLIAADLSSVANISNLSRMQKNIERSRKRIFVVKAASWLQVVQA